MATQTGMADFARRDVTLDGETKTVFRIGQTGPAVIVLHEVYGLTSTVARLCRWFADAGFSVYAPVLLGRADADNPIRISTSRIAQLCISREFTMFVSGRSSPVTTWLRALARLAHEECGGPGVGALGLCLTGGFALSMAVDPVMLAPVLGQPSMPPFDHAGLDISPASLSCVKARTQNEGLAVLGYRFQGDTLCRAERFAALRAALGAAFHGVELPDDCANPAGMRAAGKKPHSVFTEDLIDAPGEPTRAAVNEVIAFFRDRLCGNSDYGTPLPPGVQQGV